MNEFEFQLLRLKECLQVSEDQQVATALGMTKAAFSDRKKRQSFPSDRVVALKASLPELDVHYILTGERWAASEKAFHEVLFRGAAESGDGALMASVAAGAINHVEAISKSAARPLVRSLIELLHFCSDDDLDLLVRVAAKLSSRHAKG